MDYIIKRLKEKSTYIVLFSLLANITGISVLPELREVISTVCISIISLVGILMEEA